MLSSLPGIGRSTRSGSQSVSISATVVMPSLRASLTAFFSFFGSMITRHSGSRFIVRMPLQVAVHLAILAGQGRLHLLRVGGDLLAVADLLQLLQPREPVADRAEIGQRAAQPAIADERHAAALGLASGPCRAACRFVPTNSTRLPRDGDLRRDTSWPAAGRESSRGRR